jgi:hypothetical protein
LHVAFGAGGGLTVLAGLFLIGYGFGRWRLRIRVRATLAALGGAALLWGLALLNEVVSQGTMARIFLGLIVITPLLLVIVWVAVTLHLSSLQRIVRDRFPRPRPAWVEKYFPDIAEFRSTDEAQGSFE